MAIDRTLVVSSIVVALITLITTTLWNQFSIIFVNVFYNQNIPINQSQSYLGVILFAGVFLSGLFLVLYILRITKEKPIEIPPTGIQYDQITCRNCNHPNIVYPPLRKYKGVVLSECKGETLEPEHNVKSQIKCRNCRKKIEFYWCTGHLGFFNVDKRPEK